MRIRWQTATQREGWSAECDLAPAKARKRFKELGADGLVGWAELVAEDEDEGGYMEVIDSFDHSKQAALNLELKQIAAAIFG